MLILAQDRKSVYNFDNLEGLMIRERKYIIAYGSDGDGWYTLGEYESEEICMAIILEFTNFYGVCKDSGLTAYYMPPKNYAEYKSGNYKEGGLH